jgi:hypothetical protein
MLNYERRLKNSSEKLRTEKSTSRSLKDSKKITMNCLSNSRSQKTLEKSKRTSLINSNLKIQNLGKSVRRSEQQDQNPNPIPENEVRKA